MNPTCRKFDAFEQSLNACEEGSPGYAAVEQEIQAAYAQLCRDDSFQHARKRHAYLRHKLQHIKTAVHQFDDRR